MKKRLLFLVILAFLLQLFSASSLFYDIEPECNKDICIEGQDVIWHITIYNKGDTMREYVAVELYDRLNDSLFLNYTIDFRPLSTQRGDTILVYPESKAVIELNGTLPGPNIENTLIYYACFTRATDNDDWVYRPDEVYILRQCYDLNESMTIFPCIKNDNCEDNEVCIKYRCYELECVYCQYAENHRCNLYECCESDECEYNERCLNNSCVFLDCAEDEYYENHSCFSLKCNYDEHIVNNSCVKLNCGFDEFAYGHRCNKLNCSKDEYYENHTCKSLECNYDEYSTNHSCKKLECEPNQKAYNHSCLPLDCSIFEKIVNQQCMSDKQFITKFIGELVAVILIAIFLFLDIKKYEMHHRESTSKT